MEAFLFADPDHRPRIGSVGTATERDLVHNCRAVDKPADGPYIGPCQCRVVEDRRIFRGASQQLFSHLLTADAKRLGSRIEIETVPTLVLDLRQKRGLAAQRWGTGDPVAFGKHADDFGVGMLADLPYERTAIALRHRVIRLDLLLVVDPRLKTGKEFLVLACAPISADQSL